MIMDVEINGHVVNVAHECHTLAQLLAQEGFTGVGQAVAINNRVVPRCSWDGYELAEGMKIVVVSAVCGG